MKNIYIALIAISSLTGSLSAYSACSVDLPIAELSDCIVVEGSGATYQRDRDHVPTEQEQLVITTDDNPVTANNKLSIREVN